MPDPGTHVESEDSPWHVRIGDHPQRTESPDFVAAKRVAHKILATLTTYPFGPGPWQMHHGGSLWTYDGQGWFLLLGPVGIEWSAQFACDPLKVDPLRQLVQRHYAGFPQTVPELVRLGYQKADAILSQPITDADGIARYVDSIFNSCVPLAAGVHTGVVSRKNPTGGGAHHYPRPIVDIQFVKRDDFILWVTDPAYGPVAVAPVAPRGSGDGRVELLYAQPSSPLHKQQQTAHARGQRLILPASHPAAKQAFAKQ